MRMEDLDPPREQTGAAQIILNSLQAHSLHWDGPVLSQSDRHPDYAATVADLLDRKLAFHCDCTRAQLAAQGGVYRGHCRNRQLEADSEHSVRVLITGDSDIEITDQLQAPARQNLAGEVGDFIIQRRGGLYAYQLAVVLDDALQGVNHVLRGSDLLDSTPRQVYLQRLLGLPKPVYCHIPVITNAAGDKLSKQTGASALEDTNATQNLRRALQFLRQETPPADCDNTTDVLDWARSHWQLAAIPAVMTAAESSLV
jgi:glutamyl-Q tRNA(Asp) synthetase